VVCVIPPMISLTIARNPDGTEKHTLKNVRETGEFCFNVVTEPVWREMVDSANAFPTGDSEFTDVVERDENNEQVLELAEHVMKLVS
jgi:flavin reductase (DIM6/NTAB) family NADH-FMN oxidoreductase RutF